jgi:hypothetical protein
MVVAAAVAAIDTPPLAAAAMIAMLPLSVLIDMVAAVAATATEAVVAIVMVAERLIAMPAKIAMEGGRRPVLGECAYVSSYTHIHLIIDREFGFCRYVDGGEGSYPPSRSDFFFVCVWPLPELVTWARDFPLLLPF